MAFNRDYDKERRDKINKMIEQQAPKAEEPLFKEYKFYNKKPKDSDPIVNSVLHKINQRSKLGMKKYGVPMTRKDISTLEWLKHAQEEAMDMAVYLERLIQDYDSSDFKAWQKWRKGE